MTRSTYVKVLDNLADHPSWLEVPPAGIGLWVLSLGYCSRNLTDGMFPRLLIDRWGGHGSTAHQDLIDAGRWHVTGHDCEDCPEVPQNRVYVHGYLDHQRSSEQVAELSEKRREAGRAGGNARVAKQVGKQNPSRSNPEAETDTKKDSTAAVAADFEEWWQRYPRKTAKPAAAKAYAKARKSATVTELAQGLMSAKAEWDAARTEPQFLPHATTWLNQGRWSDEPAVLPGTTGPRVTPRPLTLAEIRAAEAEREGMTG